MQCPLPCPRGFFGALKQHSLESHLRPVHYTYLLRDLRIWIRRRSNWDEFGVACNSMISALGISAGLVWPSQAGPLPHA